MPLLTPEKIDRFLKIIQEYQKDKEPPVVERKSKNDPFKTLIACLISLRNRDEVTDKAVDRLFAIASTPEAILNLSEDKIAEQIYPVVYYRNKSRTLRAVSSDIIKKHKGKVPSNMKDLLALSGVGRKTANLVLTVAFGKSGICVDTHVHRITNRWGFVRTKAPDDTESVLRRRLPKKWWLSINSILVTFGQTICRPVKPRCNICPLLKPCPFAGKSKRPKTI